MLSSPNLSATKFLKKGKKGDLDWYYNHMCHPTQGSVWPPYPSRWTGGSGRLQIQGHGQGWHILWIIFKKSSPADIIGLNWRKLDKSREKWIKLIFTIVKGWKGQFFWWIYSRITFSGPKSSFKLLSIILNPRMCCIFVWPF